MIKLLIFSVSAIISWLLVYGFDSPNKAGVIKLFDDEADTFRMEMWIDEVMQWSILQISFMDAETIAKRVYLDANGASVYVTGIIEDYRCETS